MQLLRPAKLLQVFISERDRYEGKPLYEAIVEKCREMEIAGATVLRGLQGYGETAEIHRAHLIGHDLPIEITIVDSAENIAHLTGVVEGMIDHGAIAVSDVMVRRIQK